MTTRIKRLLAMKFGPRSYTPEQEAFIRQTVAERKPLPERPLPFKCAECRCPENCVCCTDDRCGCAATRTQWSTPSSTGAPCGCGRWDAGWSESRAIEHEQAHNLGKA